MKAIDILREYGQKLIGKVIDTEPMGDYPGGRAIITEILPDPNAQEISFTVKHESYGEIGVFWYEYVSWWDDIHPELYLNFEEDCIQ